VYRTARGILRTGGADGNEVLTTATAVLLTCLLVAEGITIIDLGGLTAAHMFIGMALIPPVALKLGSTGYRFARYYTGSSVYRAKGPPLLPLRLMAPVLVLATVAVFATGVALLLVGHKSDSLLFFHKLSFIVWGAVFGIHFLAYLPRLLRSLRYDWTAARRRQTGGAGLRAMLIAAAVGGGGALAASLLPMIDAWHAGSP
jgi:hypothetical protein